MLLAIAGIAVVTALAGCGGDDDGGGTDPASLTSRLPANVAEGFKVERNFEWDSAIDLVAQGLFLPAATPPSEAVDKIDGAGFEAAAGQELVVSKGNTFEGPRMTIDVIKLGSADEALEVRDYLHAEDLKQPCFSVCSQDPGELAVEGIPDAKGVESVPQKNPPPNAPPPHEAYAVEFPVDSYLYVVTGGGAPGQLESKQVIDTAKTLYGRSAGGETPST
jgi:hypothetical protein